MKLDGRVALVTGAGRGIGRAIASALAAEGAAVAVNYRSSRAGAVEVVDAITAGGGKAITVEADVSEPDQADRAVRETVEALGGLHILVNNAGITQDALIANMTADDWLKVMKINFGGVFNCTRAALEHLLVQRDGAIVNVSSVMGERGWQGASAYSASKAAVNVFTRSCAYEVARFGVRVNAVLPGFVPTEMVSGIMKKDGGRGVLQQIPVRSFGSAEAVASAVVFLAGPDSGYTTGALLAVDGGATTSIGLGRPL